MAPDLDADGDGIACESLPRGTLTCNAVAGSGITKGCNPPANTRFCPNNYVTRGQMAAFLHRALD